MVFLILIVVVVVLIAAEQEGRKERKIIFHPHNNETREGRKEGRKEGRSGNDFSPKKSTTTTRNNPGCAQARSGQDNPYATKDRPKREWIENQARRSDVPMTKG